jgi:molecular chaperone GrpE
MQSPYQIDESGIEIVPSENEGEKPETNTAEPSDGVNELVAQLQKEVEAEKAKSAEYQDRMQRTLAESMNTRKRMEKQLADSIERASTHLITRLLPVLDDLDLAFRNAPENLPEELTPWLNGFRQIQKKLETLLEEQQVVKFEDKGLLDPTRHEAISSEPNDEVESGHIIATLRLGYEQKGRILRPALVRVAA